MSEVKYVNYEDLPEEWKTEIEKESDKQKQKEKEKEEE
jgi:hypothetical protein